MEYNDLMGLWKSMQNIEKGNPQSHYTRKVIDFAQSRNQGRDVVIKIYGDYVSKASYTGNVGDATIRLSHRNASEIPITEFKKSKGVFSSIYVTSTDTSGSFVFYVGGAWSGEIETGMGEKVSLVNSAGVDVDPVQDKRYKAHTFGDLKPTTMTAANTAQPLIAASTKVKWAIIHTLSKVALIGSSTLTRGGGANDGQKYGEDVYIAVEYIDLSEMYIINFTVGEQCIYSINYALEAT